MRWCRISRIGEINICLPWPRPHRMQENSGKRKLICTIVNSSAVNSSSQQRAREILCNNTSWSTQVLLAKLFPFNHLRLLTFPLQLEHIPKHFLTLRIFGTGPHLCSSCSPQGIWFAAVKISSVSTAVFIKNERCPIYFSQTALPALVWVGDAKPAAGAIPYFLTLNTLNLHLGRT